jgi:hypothetical protein
MPNSVSVAATSSSGIDYTIALTVTGPKTATIDLGNGESYALTGMQRNGDSATCQTSVLFATAQVAVLVGPASVEIEVSGIWLAPPPATYAISAADSAAIIAWLQNFPEGGAAVVFPYEFGKGPPLSFPFKFGRRRMVAPKACMRFRDYQLLSFPGAPASGDYRPQAAQALAQMYDNDTLGDCVIAWMAHAIGVFTGNASGTPDIFSTQDIVSMYAAIGGYNPADPSTDQGCDENTALDYWQATGFVGHKISGILSVDATNPKECAAAVWLFENLMFGVALPDEWTHPTPAGSGFVWDVAGDPDPDQGHCFGSASWDENGVGVQSWGMSGSITYAAVAKYAVASAGGQLFSVITPEILNKATLKSPAGFDFNQLTADFVGMGGTVTTAQPPNPTLVGKKA